MVTTEGLEGKVAIVTGAAMGIGRETALEFCDAGAKVVIADIDEKKAIETLNLIKSRNKEAIYVHCDVSKTSDIDTLVSRTLKEYNKIDILVNNCAVQLYASALDTTDEQWNKVIEVILSGTFFMCRAVIPSMVKQKWGRIINISSACGLQGAANFAAYSAAKGGVVSLTKQLAIELIDKNINVNCICPGTIDTNNAALQQMEASWGKQAVIDSTPRKKLGLPKEIAMPILFLSSSSADLITGAILPVDGGLNAKMSVS